jgi:uncharacterized membrane protein
MLKKDHFLFQYLKKEKIRIDQNEFRFQIESHPDGFSLLSISDTFSFFKISNLATRIEHEDLIHLPDRFIALIKEESAPFLAFIERLGNDYLYTYQDKPIVISAEKFDAMFQNIVLLAEQGEQEPVVSKNNKLRLTLFPLILIYLASIFINGFSLLPFLLIVLLSIGVYLSVEALSHEFGIKTKFSETVCNFSANTDCDAVIDGKKSKLLEIINFSDSSFIFFIGQLLALLFLTISSQTDSFYTITTILLLVSLPVTIASIYQQWFIIKKWCPICLAIIAVIYLELFNLLYFNGFSISTSMIAVIHYLLAFAICFLLAFSVKKIIKTNFELNSKITESNRFKRDYSLFKLALLNSDKIKNNTVLSRTIILGNRDAKLKIIVISSPFCGHCKDTHQIIEDLLALYHDKIAIEIRFNYDGSFSDEKSRLVHQYLVQLYFEKGEIVFTKALQDWFENKNFEALKGIADMDLDNASLLGLLEEQFLWNKSNGFTFTPAIIVNGYHLPKQYNRNDLIHFINDLEDDEFL